MILYSEVDVRIEIQSIKFYQVIGKLNIIFLQSISDSLVQWKSKLYELLNKSINFSWYVLVDI